MPQTWHRARVKSVPASSGSAEVTVRQGIVTPPQAGQVSGADTAPVYEATSVLHWLAMPRTQPNPVLRARIELAIGIVAPVLDVLLAVGDRVSRVLASGDPDPLPPRLRHEGEHAPRGLPPRRSS